LSITEFNSLEDASMALTNFGLLTDEQKTAWSMDLWKQARNYSFIDKFAGSGANSMVHKVTELKQDEKGARAVITLLADLEGDGIAGDRTLKGNEEAIKSYDQVIRIDQLRNANTNEGRIADQKSIVNFRKASKDVLAYWIADRLDQLALLTLSGRAYSLNNDGTTRTGSDLPYLEFAADVVAASANRRYQWDASNGLTSGGLISDVTASDTPTWEMLVNLKAAAQENYVRGIRGEGNEEVYNVFMTPTAFAKLKMDPDFMQNVRHAREVGGKNPLFTGAAVTVDGLAIHTHRHVYHGALGAASAQACQILMCGAQSLAMADINNATWNEEVEDYGNRLGIAVSKIVGFLKPQYNSIYSGTTEDFGVVSCFCAQ
jgi:N4-gp56 family major capsid protein